MLESSRGSGCTLVLLSFTFLSLWINIQSLLILQNIRCFSLLIPSASFCLQIINITNFRFFTSASDESSDSGWTSDSDGPLLEGFQTLISSDYDLQLSFSWKFVCSHLFFQNQYFASRHINFSLWSYTLEQIFAYPIKFLIPCYHQNLKNMSKHILFQHKNHKFNINEIIC